MKMKWLYILILLIPVCTCGWMNTIFMGGGIPPAGGGTPVALDASSSGTVGGGGATSLIISHTCTGTNRLLLMWYASNDLSINVTGATYNSVSMSQEATVSSADSQVRIFLFSLIAPATGANNIVISFASSGHANGVGLGRSFTAVHQTTAVGTPVTAEDTETNDTNPQVQVTGAANSTVADGVAGRRGSLILTIGANQTDELTDTEDSVLIASASLETGTGTRNMDWTTNTPAAWGQIGILVNPASP